MEDFKQCKCCGENLPNNFEYYPKKNGKTYSYCKKCHSQKQKDRIDKDRNAYNEQRKESSAKFRENNQEHLREYHRNWSNENREHVNQKSLEWYYKNQDKAKEIRSNYYWNNRDARLQYSKQHRENNKEKRNLQIKEWAKNNVEKCRASWHRYIARKRSLPNDFTDSDYAYALNYWNYCCAITGEQCELSLDHWIPLNSSECPGTIPSNMIPIKSSLNSAKQDKNPYEFLVSYFGKEFADNKIEEIERYFNSVRK